MSTSSSPDTPAVIVEHFDTYASLTLNRPASYNALSEEMMAALQEALNTLAQDARLHCIVIKAAGKAFCAGHNLKEMRAQPEQAYYERLFQQCSKMMQSIVHFPVPVIAQVHGMATAAGCQLVASCDLALASDDASFAVSGINVGLFCSTPAVALSRNIGSKAALEMLMTGRFISAAQAQAQGLINHSVPGPDLATATQELVQAICSKSPAAVRTGKAMFYKQAALPLEQAYDYAGHIMACNMMHADATEGIDAFIEKRPAVWGKTA